MSLTVAQQPTTAPLGKQPLAQRWEQWRWLLLACAAPILLFPQPNTAIAMIAVPVVWLIGLVSAKRAFPRTPLNPALLLLMIMVAVSLFVTPSPAMSLPKVAGLVLGVGVCTLMADYGRNARGWLIVWLLFAFTAAGIAVVGLLGADWMQKLPLLSKITAHLPRRVSGLPGAEDGFHPNQIAGTLLWALPLFISLSVTLIRSPQNWVTRFGYGRTALIRFGVGLITLLLLGVFVLAQSRGGFLALLVTCLSLSVIAIWRMRRGLAIGLLIGMALAGLLLIVGGSPIQDLAVDEVARGSQALSLHSVDTRRELWSRGWYAVQEFPLTGMGMNMFRTAGIALYPPLSLTEQQDIAHAHNMLLQAALDLGIPGAVALVALHLAAFGMLWQLLRIPAKSPEEAQHLLLDEPRITTAVILGLGGGLLAHLIYGLTDTVALGAKTGILLWMVFGLIAGLYLQRSNA